MNSKDFLTYEQEISQAIQEFPELEMGEAYTKWKRIRGEEPAPKLRTDDESLKQVKKEILQVATRPCDQSGCNGTQTLESICGGCIEGRKGYKSKWTCNECLHRELSKEDYWECLKKLSSSLSKG